MITYFKDKNIKSKRKYVNYKLLTTTSKTFDTNASIATTTSSITLILTGIGLIVKPKSSSIACGLTLSNKFIFEIVKQKYNKYKNQ